MLIGSIFLSCAAHTVMLHFVIDAALEFIEYGCILSNWAQER